MSTYFSFLLQQKNYGLIVANAGITVAIVIIAEIMATLSTDFKFVIRISPPFCTLY
jgi:hypothetical protein